MFFSFFTIKCLNIVNSTTLRTYIIYKKEIMTYDKRMYFKKLIFFSFYWKFGLSRVFTRNVYVKESFDDLLYKTRRFSLVFGSFSLYTLGPLSLRLCYHSFLSVVLITLFFRVLFSTQRTDLTLVRSNFVQVSKGSLWNRSFTLTTLWIK